MQIANPHAEKVDNINVGRQLNQWDIDKNVVCKIKNIVLLNSKAISQPDPSENYWMARRKTNQQNYTNITIITQCGLSYIVI